MKSIIRPNKFFSLMTLVYLLCVITIIYIDRGNSSIQRYSFVIIIIIAGFLNTNHLLLYITALIPLGKIFVLNGSYTCIPFIIIIFIVKILIKKTYYNSKFIASFLLLLIINMLVSYYYYQNITPVIPFFVYLFFIYVAIENDSFDDLYLFKNAGIVFLISMVIVCICSVVFVNAVYKITETPTYAYRATGFSNTWNFGQNLVVAIAFTTVLLKNKHIKIIYASILIAMFSYFIILTGLFSAIPGIILLLMLHFYIIKSNNSFNKNVNFIVILLCALILILYIIPNMINLRKTLDDNGRFDIWIFYLSEIINNFNILLFGVGGGCIGNFAQLKNTLTSHNIIIEKLTELGIIGFGILIYMLKQIYRNTITNFKINPNIIPLLCFLATTMTQGLSGNELVFLLIVLGVKKTAV